MSEDKNQSRQIDARIVNTDDLLSMFGDLDRLKNSDFTSQWHSFPTTRESLQATLKDIGVDGKAHVHFLVTDYDTVIHELNSVLPRFADLDELNYLAVKMDGLSEQQHDIFRSVVEAGRHCESMKDIINITENMDCFDIQPAYASNQYGEFLSIMASDKFAGTIDKLSKSQDPEMRELAEYITRLETYFDADAYAKDVVKAENGVFTEQGYLTESNSFREVYRGPKDIPAEHRLTTPPVEPERKTSLLGQLAAAKDQASDAARQDVPEKKAPSGPEL